MTENIAKLNINITSVDIKDCSDVVKSDRWKFIHSSDDNFEEVDKYIKNKLDFIFIDSLHEPNHVEKVLYHYYSFLKKGGICIIDDISWLPYSKNQERDKEFIEHINRSTFKKILEIFNQNQKKIGNFPILDFFINAKIQQTRIYFKFEHFNSSLTGYNFYSAPNYPFRDFSFRFGLVWNFFS